MPRVSVKPTIIYAILDPDIDEVRYVGKTECQLRKRLWQHVNNAKKGAPTYFAKWLRSILKQQKEARIIALATVPPGKDWKERECYYIALYREQGHPITNLTLGGDGLSSPSESVRKKMRRATKERFEDPAYRAEHIRKQRERWQKPEEHEKTSLSQKQRYKDPLQGEQQSQIQSELWADPAHHQKMTEGSRRYWGQEENRARRAQDQKKKWEDPEYRKRQGEALQGRKMSQATRAQMSKARKQWIQAQKERGIYKNPVADASKKRADEFAGSLRPIVEKIIRSGKTRNYEIRDELNRRGIKTSMGSEWGNQSVLRLLRRIRRD